MTRPIGSMDSGTLLDASMQTDANTDASSDVDAASVEPGPACSTGSMSVSTVSDTYLDPLAPLALALRTDGASLGWLGLDNGKSRAFVRWFGLAEATADVPVLSTDEKQTELAVVATGTGFLTVTSDEVAGSFQLRARRTNTAGELLDVEPVLLTNDAAGNHAPVLARGADGNVIVVWSTQSPRVQGKVALLRADGATLEAAHDIPDFGASVGRAVISPMGNDYLLAWVDAAMRRVHVQRLAASGLPVGASRQVDADGDARGNLDLTFTGQGGALVFDILVAGARPEVRLRTFTVEGVPSGNERRLTPYPETGTRPSLVSVRGGYMLAYRGARTTDQQLRIALLDGQGSLVKTANVAPLASFDLPLVLRMSPDGEAVFLGWLDQLLDSHGYQLQRTWIHCD